MTFEPVQQGMAPGEARRLALRDFGGVEAVKEYARDARGVRPLEDFVFDLRYAVRTLRQNAALTSAAVLTFALGIGAASAIFSVVYGILLRPLPYAHADRLVALWERNLPRNRDQNVVSVDNFEAWRDSARAFDAMAALVPRPVTLVEGGTPERIVGADVSPGYFDLLGVAPAHGREFAAGDARPGAAGVVILSDGFWRRRFGGDPAVIGRALSVGGQPHTIVGVMPNVEPPRFGWLSEQQLWFPFVPTAENRAWGRFLLVVARLAPGVTLDAARAEMAAITERRARAVLANREWRATLTLLAQQIFGVFSADVAHRRREIGVRLALGAGSWRVVAMVLRRALARAALGVVAGAVVALLLARSMASLLFGVRPTDPLSLAMVAALLLAVAVCATLFPALKALRSSPLDVLRSE